VHGPPGYQAPTQGARAQQIQALVVHAYAVEFLPGATPAEVASAQRAKAMVQCPVCGVVVARPPNATRTASAAPTAPLAKIFEHQF
jgi:anti-sigma factor RsiW